MLLRVILAIDKPGHAKKLRAMLDLPDVVLETVRRKDLFWEHISRESGDLVLVSQSLIPEPIGQTVEALGELPDVPSVVVLSEREDAEERARLLAAGCDAVIYAGLSDEALQEVVSAIVAKRSEAGPRELTETEPLAEPRLSDFVSASPAMQTFMGTVQRVVAHDVPLLILGETGVGKEWLARAVHAESPRAEGPFVAVNLGALPETLIESELFGHEEGSFTGATRARRGAFELAHGGTIFLDEIGEIPGHLQVKLLRVLQEHKVQRVGSEEPLTLDVRVMAATNRDLEQDVQAERFRRDLYFRLSVVTLTVPALRERTEDIPALAESHIEYFRPRVSREVYSISPDALAALAQYEWPGNVRELMNVIERAMLLCDGTEVGLDDVPEVIAHGARPAQIAMSSLSDDETDAGIPPDWLQRPWRQVREAALAQIERAYLMGLLQATGGRVGETAKRAGLQPRSLYDKMKQYGIQKEDFRGGKRGR